MSKKLANTVMVALIAVIAVCGIALALHFRDDAPQEVLGSQFTAVPIPDNALVVSPEPENLCTITIRCDTIVENLDSLEPVKEPYVPRDGIILPETTVEFTPGQTVFDVLKQVCDAAQVQLEYSWTPLYDSYYIEGISHLYEFDCGFESGWMYEVNGWFPNYGCSAYVVQPGDSIQWCYTCVGLGADLGAPME